MAVFRSVPLPSQASPDRAANQCGRASLQLKPEFSASQKVLLDHSVTFIAIKA